MSIGYDFFIGPYAQWFSPEPSGDESVWDWPVIKTLVDGGVFEIQHNLGDFPEFKRGGRWRYRYTLMSAAAAGGSPSGRCSGLGWMRF
jgi:hypothetical protein